MASNWWAIEVTRCTSGACGFNNHPIAHVMAIGAGPLGPESQVAVKGVMGFPLVMET